MADEPAKKPARAPAPAARRVKSVDRAKPANRAASTRGVPEKPEKKAKPVKRPSAQVTPVKGMAIQPVAKTRRTKPATVGTPVTAAAASVPTTATTRDGMNAPADELAKLVGEVAGQVFGDAGDEKVTQAIEFLRRRVTGDYEVDAFGFDLELTDAVLLPLLRPLYRRWFRVEVRGIENIPAEGAALIVANHSGTIPLDSLMTEVAVHDEHPAHRHLRMLGADLVFQMPFVSDVARKNGTTLACNEDTERLLAAGELVAVWPEDFKGIGKPFSERYKLQRFGRGGFVSAAIRARAPIIPCAIVGAEETYPMIANLATLARVIGMPYIPITPTFPWLGPLGLVPLPSKWIIEFGEPIGTDGQPDGGAEDPMLVFELTDRVRETIQQTLYALLVRRRSTFF